MEPRQRGKRNVIRLRIIRFRSHAHLGNFTLIVLHLVGKIKRETSGCFDDTLLTGLYLETYVCAIQVLGW